MSYSFTFTVGLDKIEKILGRPLTEKEQKEFKDLIAWVWEEATTHTSGWDSD
jgi:hypothetical protein